jgi:hypothetical protein
VNDWVDERLESFDSPGAPRWILCVPAADRADEIVAKLLSSALLERGVGATWVKPEALDQVPLAENSQAIQAVVVSALPPEAVAPARAVCRSVRSRARDLPLMVGLWDPESDLTKPRERLEAAGAGNLVVSFADCVTALEALATAPPAARPPAATARGAVLQA